MSHEARRASMLKKYGLSGVNKPKRTPSHKTKSHMVLAQEGHELKLIRFGQQGVKGAGKNPQSDKEKKRFILQTLFNPLYITTHTWYLYFWTFLCSRYHFHCIPKLAAS